MNIYTTFKVKLLTLSTSNFPSVLTSVIGLSEHGEGGIGRTTIHFQNHHQTHPGNAGPHQKGHTPHPPGHVRGPSQTEQGLQLSCPALGVPAWRPYPPTRSISQLQVPHMLARSLHRWVGPINYCLQQPGKKKSTQMYHINLLKCWIEPFPSLSVHASDPTSPAGHTLVQKGKDPPATGAGRTAGAVPVCVFSKGRLDPPDPVQHPNSPGSLSDNSPIMPHKPAYQATDKEVAQMLWNRVIEESTSPLSSPTVMVPKPDGT